MRHTASVPKGFLRHLVLRLLNEKAISGSEIMSEIEKRTDGDWKPSPGSIYPLLAWLHTKGYTTTVPDPEPGIKRYALTESGKAFLAEHTKRRREIRQRIEIPIYEFGLTPEILPLVQTMNKLGKINRTLREGLHQKFSEEVAKEAQNALEQTITKLEKLFKKLGD